MLKNMNKKALGILSVLIIAGALVYGSMKKEASTSEVQQEPVVVSSEQENKALDQQPTLKTFQKVTMESKARIQANVGSCKTEGNIGATIQKDEPNEYFIFAISSYDTSHKNYVCVVDLYAKTTELINTNPVCNSDGQCYGSGLLPTPKKKYDSILTAPAQ
jgi:hypothetical protein